jgi:hypothetical protein
MKWKKEKYQVFFLESNSCKFSHHEEAGKPDLNLMESPTDYIKRTSQINPIKRINYKRTMGEDDEKFKVQPRIETEDYRFIERMKFLVKRILMT